MKRLRLSPRSVLQHDHALVTVRIGFRNDDGATFQDNIVTLVEHLSGRMPAEASSAVKDDYAVSVVSVREDGSEDSNTNCGTVEFAVPDLAFPADHGYPLLLAISTFGSVFSSVVEYQLIDIELPERYLSTLQGPFHGAEATVQMMGDKRVAHGIVLRPRFHATEELLTDYVREFVAAGIDYIVDDELTTPEPLREFCGRISIIRRAIEAGLRSRKGSQRHCPSPIFIATVTSRTTTAIDLAKRAVVAGADGVMINPIVMGFDVLQSLAEDSSFSGLAIANMIGRSLLTGGPRYRISPVLLCKLTRLAGADAIYIQPFAGQIRNPTKSAAEYEAVLTQQLSSGTSHHASTAIMSGGMGLAELVANEKIYEGPLMLSIGERCAAAWDRGAPPSVVLDCLRETRDAVAEGGREALERALLKLRDRGRHHRECLEIFGADSLVNDS